MFTFGAICFGFGAGITGVVIAGIAFWEVYKRDRLIDTLHMANKELSR